MDHVTHTTHDENGKVEWRCIYCHEPTGAGPCKKPECINANERAALRMGVTN